MSDMSDYYHEETVLELEQENILLKAQRDELLEAAKDACRLLDFEPAHTWGAFQLLVDTIAKIERQTS
jgi:hypothetical protein